MIIGISALLSLLQLSKSCVMNIVLEARYRDIFSKKMNVFNIIKNNWKKSLFAALASGYGVVTLKSYYKTALHMKSICNKIKKDPSSWESNSPKRVLVILNPFAHKKKAEKSFKKYCEPILHLAGYSVEIIKTTHIGHAKTYIEGLKKFPDAIVIAGGDGTTSEVVTGLLRHAGKTCPIAILPLGCRNESAFKYLEMRPKNQLEYIKFLSNSLLPMIQEKIKDESVIQYDVIDNNKNHTKPIFGLNRFSWGLIRDIEISQDKYWYFGPFRYYVAAFLKSFSDNLKWQFETGYIYTPPCPGCGNCIVEKEKGSKRISLLKKLSFVKTNEIEQKRTKYVNMECDVKVEGYVKTNQLNIFCGENEQRFFQLESEFINALQPGWDFIRSIPKLADNTIQPSLVLKGRTIQLFPASDTENSCYFIDGEEYDIRPIKITIIPNAIQVYR